MIVADMQALLQAARQFAEAAEISATARQRLVDVCGALEPFCSMDVGSFATFLRQAEEYQRTGVLPVPGRGRATASRKAKPSGAELAQQVDHLTRQLHDLYAVVHEETVGYGAIDEICDTVGKLNKPEVVEVAKRFGLTLPKTTTKPKALEAIKRKLTEQKGSAQRIQPIGSSS